MATQTPTRPTARPPLGNASEIRVRLNRVEGQVGGIRRMYEEGRPCLEILDQLAAARAALDSLGLLVLEDHVGSCLEPVVHDRESDSRAASLLLAVRRFVRSG